MNLVSSRFWHRAAFGAACFISLVLLAGCSSKKEGKVTGKVTFDGQPLPGGNVLLQSESTPENVTAAIKKDGTYEIGAITPGTYFVGVETESIKMFASGKPYGEMPKPPPGVKVPEQPKFESMDMPKYVEIPQKYANPKTSGLPKLTIQKGEKISHEINLSK